MLCPISGGRCNVYVQSQIGSELEAMWGTATWLMIFLMGGAFGNLASMVFLPTSIGVGASGGIMGLLGVRSSPSRHERTGPVGVGAGLR